MADRHDRSSESLASASGQSPGADVLSDVLRSIRLTGALFFPFQASSPWADAIPAAPQLVSSILPGAQHVVSYHIVSQGTCWLTLDNGPAAQLHPGDVVIVPHGEAYVMSSAAGLRAEMPQRAVLSFFREMALGSAPSMVVEGGGGPAGACLVCGFLGCDVRPFNPVLEALPPLVHLRPASGTGRHDRLTPLIEFALAESQEGRAGARSVLLRLSEVLFIEVVRRYLESLPADGTGWLAGLRDPIAGRALARLHHRPSHPWTLERLARDIGVSRSALAERFAATVGQPPMRYLAHWRMQLASRRLAEYAPKIAAVAHDVGYQSEAAFSRAFKEIVGVSPAAWRRRSLSSPKPASSCDSGAPSRTRTRPRG
jgi:AraC-like DNA-binding protein